MLLENGRTKHMIDLAIGDRVRTVSANGQLGFSPIVYLPHARNHLLSTFLTLTTKDGSSLTMTPDHLLPAMACDADAASVLKAGELSANLVAASTVIVGDCVLVVDGDEGGKAMKLTEVVHIKTFENNGVYTAVTKNPFLVVDGVVASPFALLHHVPDTFYSPIRMLYDVCPSALETTYFTSFMSYLGTVVDMALPTLKTVYSS